MAGDAVQITGLPELHRSFSTLGAELKDLTTLNREIGNDLARAVASAAPVRTGRLAGSFRGKGDRDSASAESTLDYAGPTEYGVPRRNVPAQHFAEQALDRAAPAVEAKYDAGVAKLCRKAEG